MDAPPHTCLMNLTVMTRDRKAWRALAGKENKVMDCSSPVSAAELRFFPSSVL